VRKKREERENQNQNLARERKEEMGYFGAITFFPVQLPFCPCLERIQYDFATSSVLSWRLIKYFPLTYFSMNFNSSDKIDW
jgi:hypothetical protein